MRKYPRFVFDNLGRETCLELRFNQVKVGLEAHPTTWLEADLTPIIFIYASPFQKPIAELHWGEGTVYLHVMRQDEETELAWIDFDNRKVRCFESDFVKEGN